MNWYKQAQWDMYGQPLEFQEESDNSMYNQTISDKNHSWYDNEGNYKRGPVKSFYEEMRELTGEIEWMSPDEYIDRCTIGAYEKDKDILYDYSYEDFKEKVINYRRNSTIGHNETKNLIDAYKDRWIAGEQPPMGYLMYNEGNYAGQEGLHRALMAKDLGVIEIPVLILNRK